MDPARTRIDVLVASVCAAGGLLLVLLRARSDVGWAPTWAEVATQLGAAALLLARSRHPLLVLAGCAAASVVSPVIATLGAAHATGLYVASSRTSIGAMLAAVTVTWPTWLLTSESTGPSALWAGIVVILFAYAAGRLQRLQQEEDAHGAARAEAGARAAERSALARDLHDVVSHRMSYAVVEAEVLRTTTADDDVRLVAQEIGTSCRAALAEMRTVLRALTAGGDAPVGGPGGAADGAAELETRVAEARRAGQPVQVVGAWAAHGAPDVVDRTVLRVVDEGLTNALRHAPGAATVVELGDGEGELRVSVENRPPTAPPTGLTTGGFGLTGLRERVTLLGGTLDAGPTVEGGYRLRAALPRRPA
ncbi:sensor histidine kinase [Krasilnikoviella flava]|uniref:histidine kinase n=1 Tax=Krasilnikoviella flava TaxID=526729 RepID=A0A1T5LLB3_9MICO|nr:sensor histidine kinase [Krasilnikoviella flava]SKC76674.1 Signal transduction histidine kinase [Krasilnikoviella flava]